MATIVAVMFYATNDYESYYPQSVHFLELRSLATVFLPVFVECMICVHDDEVFTKHYTGCEKIVFYPK